MTVRWETFTVASMLALLPLIGAGAGPAETPDLLRQRAQVRWERVPREVLAFYYGWYGNPRVSGRWFHWTEADAEHQRIGDATHFPVDGSYDSHDPSVVERHCRQAKEAGITGFIVSWWEQGDFHDQGLPLLLEAARKAGLKVTVYFETVHPRESPTPEGALRDVLYLLEHYGRHPAWLKVRGKPVLFVYGRAVGEIGVDGWLRVITGANRRYPKGAVFIGDQLSRRAAHVFDGIHTYNVTGSTAGRSEEQLRDWAHAVYPQAVRSAGEGRIACVTVIPGYDDRKLGRPAPRPITDRRDGQTYRALWEEAIAADPDWVLLTSWNEWHEGSELEPSVENGDRELRTTARYAPRFHALAPRVPSSHAAAIPQRERAALRSRLRALPIALLPGSDAEALWFLLQWGVTPTPVTWEQIADPAQFNAQKYPVALYADGEIYTATVRETDDVPRALRRYVEAGGRLAVLPSMPMPFWLDASHRTPAGAPSIVADHGRRIGLPLAIVWEQPPPGALTFTVLDAPRLPHTPAHIPYPSGGDLRWRPLMLEQLDPAAAAVPLIELRDAVGKSLGPGAALVRHGNGAILYAWFRLLEIPETEGLLHDLWTLLAER